MEPLIGALTYTEWTLGVGFVVSTGSFIFTLFKFLHERAERRVEQKRTETLAAEMREIQRRGRAPFLRAAYLHVPAHGGASNQIIHLGQGVDPARIAPDTILALDLANDGEEVRNVNDDWPQSEGLQLAPWGIKNDSTHASRLCYVYDPTKLGQPRRITIYFETLDGLKLNQVYETRHGFCEFRRVDPS